MGRLIDADKLKQHYAWWENGSAEMTLAEAKRTFDTIIDVQPTVDAVPTEFHDKCMEIEIEKRFELELKKKHGHWLAVKGWDDDLGELDSAECSVCHETQESEYWAKTYYKYCPNCGAKMDEVEDG